MKKYLDILIFTLLFFLLFSFFANRGEQKIQNSGVQFSVQKEKYTIPASVALTLSNYTTNNLILDVCNDIVLRKDGEVLRLPESLCKEQTINPQNNYTLDLAGNYQLFEQPGQYMFEYAAWEKKFIETFEVKYRGAIGKMFIGLFYAPIYNLFSYLINLFNNSLGWAIIAMTVIIRIVLLFPQHKMMVSQRKMQAIQPKIKKLQEKYKGKQQEMGMELMKLYKEEGVNPMGACMPLLLQMPILLVMYNIILNITSLKNEFYLYGFMKNFHISQIDANFFGIDLLSSKWTTGIMLALIVAAIQYFQVRLSLAHKNTEQSEKGEVVLEKKKGEEWYSSMMPDPEMMNKFMLYGMPAMVGVFTYTLIAGVGIYWGISTLFMIFQQFFVNKIIKK